MKKNNGFADALKQVKTLSKVDKKVSLEALEDAANYFAKKMQPNISKSSFNKQHLRDSLEVVVEKDKVVVQFGHGAWYWFLVDKGHKKRGGSGRVKGQHFVRNTWDAERQRIEEIMKEKIMNKME